MEKKMESYVNIKSESTLTTSINDMEGNNGSVQLTNEDPENPENKVFHIKKCPNAKLVIDFEDFKMKHCRRVRSIKYKGQKFNSIYHPRDDTHAFYIPRTKRGIFEMKPNKVQDNVDSIQTRKKLMVKEPMEQFTGKVNSIVNISEVSRDLRKFRLKKVGLILLMCVLLIVLAYNFLNIVFFFLSFIIGGHSSDFSSGDHQDDHHTDWEKIFTCVIFAVTSLVIFLITKLYRHYHGKEKNTLFAHILTKKKALDLELEYLNNSVLFPYNMKALLSDTLDYIQVFYDKGIIYEIDDHFTG